MDKYKIIPTLCLLAYVSILFSSVKTQAVDAINYIELPNGVGVGYQCNLFEETFKKKLKKEMSCVALLKLVGETHPTGQNETTCHETDISGHSRRLKDIHDYTLREEEEINGNTCTLSDIYGHDRLLDEDTLSVKEESDLWKFCNSYIRTQDDETEDIVNTVPTIATEEDDTEPMNDFKLEKYLNSDVLMNCSVYLYKRSTEKSGTVADHWSLVLSWEDGKVVLYQGNKVGKKLVPECYIGLEEINRHSWSTHKLVGTIQASQKSVHEKASSNKHNSQPYNLITMNCHKWAEEMAESIGIILNERKIENYIKFLMKSSPAFLETLCIVEKNQKPQRDNQNKQIHKQRN